MKTRFARVAFCVLLASGALAACSSPPPQPKFPEIHFTGTPPIRLAAGTLDIKENYHPPMKAPNVDHLFPVTPIHALENWAHDRLAPAGGTNRAVFAIDNASAVETDLPPSASGIRGWFTTEQAQRYDVTVSLTLTIYDTSGRMLVSTTAKAIRYQTVAEDITPNQRDQTWYDMTKDVLADFDRQMDSNIRRDFIGFTR
jgi:hypothetical protein